MNYVTTSLLEVSVHMIRLVISWLVKIVLLEVNVDLICTPDSVS